MPEAITLTDSIENLHLKDKSEEELVDNLLHKLPETTTWTDEDRQLISSAYDLARVLHQNDEYRGKPYIYHPLRTANRIMGYMNIKDPEIIAAALLHDAVEDHASEIAQAESGDVETIKQLALERLSAQFSPRVAEIVASVSHEADKPKDLSQEEKLEAYRTEVENAASTFEGWAVKFSDWCENGVGIIHSVDDLDDKQILYFQHKYGESLTVLEARFRQSDIQFRLDVFAKGYIEQQFAHGHSRLIEHKVDKHWLFKSLMLICS